MNRKLTIYLTSTLFIINVSCSRVYYTPAINSPVASVSFTNMSAESADIYIVSDCKAMPVRPDLIENKKLDEKSRYKTHIPANKEITFRYVYNWLIKDRSYPVTAVNNFTSSVDLHKVKDVSSCISQLTFRPEENRHYEVYFGLAGEQCLIKAAEFVSSTGFRKKLTHVDLIDSSECTK